MAKYDKNLIYRVNEEGLEQGLFIGISNKHYDDILKYYFYLDMLDRLNINTLKELGKEMTQEEIEKELGYKIKIVD